MRSFAIAIIITTICAPIIVNCQNENGPGKKFQHFMLPSYKKFQPIKTADERPAIENKKLEIPSTIAESSVENSKPETTIDNPHVTPSFSDSAYDIVESSILDSFLPFDSLYPDANDGTLNEDGFEDQEKVVDVFPGALPSDFEFNLEQFPYAIQSESDFELDDEQSPENVEYKVVEEEPITKESKDTKKIASKSSKKSVIDSSKSSSSESGETKEANDFWNEEFLRRFMWIMALPSSSQESVADEEPIAESIETLSEYDPKLDESRYDSSAESSFVSSTGWKFSDSDRKSTSDSGYASTTSKRSYSDYPDVDYLDVSDSSEKESIAISLPTSEWDYIPLPDADNDYHATEPMEPFIPTAESPFDSNQSVHTDFDEIKSIPAVDSSAKGIDAEKDETATPDTATAGNVPIIDKGENGERSVNQANNEDPTGPTSNQYIENHNDIEDNEIPHKGQPDKATRISLAGFLKKLFGFIPVV